MQPTRSPQFIVLHRRKLAKPRIMDPQEPQDPGYESDPLASDAEQDAEREEAEQLFGASFDTLIADGKRGGRKRRRPFTNGSSKRRVSELPRTLNARMGSATMAYMTRNFDVAENMLLSIIQEAPKAVAPYRTLALVCEERNDMPKSLSYLLFAAHLDKKDRDLWKRCASLSYDQGDADQAIYCLTMALHGTRGQDAEALLARATIHRSLSQWRRAAENYIKVSKVTPADLSVYVHISEMSFLDGNISKAEPYLEKAVHFFGEKATPATTSSGDAAAAAHPSVVREGHVQTILQKLVEIYFSQDRFDEAHDLLVKVQQRALSGCAETPFMHRVMLAVCQYRRGSRALASVAFNEFLAQSSVFAPNPNIVWYVAEACFAGKDHVKTVKAYTALTTLPGFSKEPRLFLRRAEAHMQLKDVDAAEKDVRHALFLVPRNVEATTLLQRVMSAKDGSKKWNDRRSAANPTPSTRRVPRLGDGESGAVEKRASGKRRDTKVLLKPTVAALLEAANSAMRSHGSGGYVHVLAPVLEAALGFPFYSLRNGTGGKYDQVTREDCTEIALTTAVQKVGEDLRVLGQLVMKSLSDREYVSFVERVLDATFCLDRSEATSRAVEMLVANRGNGLQSSNQDLRLRLRALVIATLIEQGDLTRAYEELRTTAREFPLDSRIWWLHACFAPLLDDPAAEGLRSRMNFSLGREARKQFVEGNSLSAVGRILAGGVYTGRGRRNIITPRPAIKCFSYVLRQMPDIPCTALSMACYLIQMARNRKAQNRAQLVLKALSYLDEYRRLRKKQAEEWPTLSKKIVECEAEYNLARGMHEVGLVHMAAGMYAELLESSNAFSVPAWLQLRREIAFNLRQIFLRSGQLELARDLTRKHLVF